MTPPPPAARRDDRDHEVLITGASPLAALAVGVAPPRLGTGRAPTRPARLDRLSALALHAAEAALLDAGLTPEVWDADRIAIVVGTAFGCHATNEEYFRGYLADGARGASPRLFAGTLPSSPAGEISIHCGLRGPAETLPSGRHAGVEAIGRALWLCERDVVDLAIALAVDVASPTLLRLGYAVREGAAAVIVERRASAERRRATPRARLVGAAAAFRSPLASTLALAEAAVAADDPTPVERIAVAGGDDAVAPVAALIAWLAGPSLSRGQLVAEDGGGGSAVLVAVRPLANDRAPLTALETSPR